MSWFQAPATSSRRTTSGTHYTGAGTLKSVSFNSLTTGGLYQVTDNSVVIAEATLGATGSAYFTFGADGVAFGTNLAFVLPAGTGSCIVAYNAAS